MKRRTAAKAIVMRPDGKVLIVQNEGLWEAPGGRLEPDEQLHDALRRELSEETGIADLTIDEPFFAGEWIIGKGENASHIVAIYFLCHTGETEVALSHEHQAHAWVDKSEISGYSFYPACGRAYQIFAEGKA